MVGELDNTGTHSFRIKAAMIIYSLEKSLGAVVRDGGISPLESSPELVRGILTREEFDEFEELDSDSEALINTTVSSTYLDEIFQLAIDTNQDSIQGDRLKRLKAFCESLSIYDIRNAISHPNRPFPDFYWYRAATIGSDPLIGKLGFSEVSESLLNAENERVSAPPSEWMQVNIWSLPNNLPSHFDHQITGLIGRRKEFGDLKKYLNNPRVSSVAIVGPGGLGKTALALEYLESICIDPGNRDLFDGIAFVSLKQFYLTARGIESIDSVSTLNALSDEIMNAVSRLFNSNGSSLEDVKRNHAENRILLCIDNLETLLIDNQEAFRQFALELPANWKLLVTSRVQVSEFSTIALGPIEQRLAETLAKSYTAKTSSLKFSKEEFEAIARTMNNNPLAIKLTIDSCKLGKSLPDAMQGTEGDVIEFSYSGLLDALSECAIKVMECLFLKEPTTRFEISELLSEISYDEIASSLNELFNTSLVNRVPNQNREEEISLNPGIRDYLRINPKNLHIREILNERIRHSQAIAQDVSDIQEKRNIHEHHPGHIPEDTPPNLVQMVNNCNKALSSPRNLDPAPLLPSLAELKANKSLYDGLSVFHRAYARLLLRLQDYNSALDHLRIAIEIEPDSMANIYLYSKGLLDSGHHKEAEEFIEDHDPKNLFLPEKSSLDSARNLLGVYINSKVFSHKFDEVLEISSSWKDSCFKELLGGQRAVVLKRSAETIRIEDSAKANYYLIEALEILAELLEQFGIGNPVTCARSIKVLKDCVHFSEREPEPTISNLKAKTFDFSNKYLRQICDRLDRPDSFVHLTQRLASISFPDNPYGKLELVHIDRPTTEPSGKQLEFYSQLFEHEGYILTSIDNVCGHDSKGIPTYMFANDGETRYFVSLRSVPSNQKNVCGENMYVGQQVAILPEKASDDRELVSSKKTQILDFYVVWDEFASEYQPGSFVSGTITNIVDYGVFVTLPNGIVGLLHQSKISGLPTHCDLYDVFEVGEEISVVIISIDSKKRRVSFMHNVSLTLCN